MREPLVLRLVDREVVDRLEVARGVLEQVHVAPPVEQRVGAHVLAEGRRAAGRGPAAPAPSCRSALARRSVERLVRRADGRRSDRREVTGAADRAVGLTRVMVDEQHRVLAGVDARSRPSRPGSTPPRGLRRPPPGRAGGDDRLLAGWSAAGPDVARGGIGFEASQRVAAVDGRAVITRSGRIAADAAPADPADSNSPASGPVVIWNDPAGTGRSPRPRRARTGCRG